ncbi:1-phosphatidylinositol 4,5-bisphosphate phosphodiesterase zeta-1 [Mantella aurantiaca]
MAVHLVSDTIQNKQFLKNIQYDDIIRESPQCERQTAVAGRHSNSTGPAYITMDDKYPSSQEALCQLFSLNLFRTHLEDAFQCTATEEVMNYSQMMEAFQQLAVTVDSVHATVLFKEGVEERRGYINIDTFKSIYKTFIYRTEFVNIFKKYSPLAGYLSSEKILEFLQTELHESHANKQRVCELVNKYERNQEACGKTCMTFDGFARFMSSQETHIFHQNCNRIYQDMNQPLTNYFISTSHNTYLLNDQLVGESHLWAYSSALIRGCRCLEIDCWDGADDEPIVYHGFTLTSKILFKSVVYVIDKYAFMASQYPLVLSLEDHCSHGQQEVIANHLITILGDKLLRATISDPSSKVLPSPEALKGKILIKHKKIEPKLIPSPDLSGQAAGGRDVEESIDEESDEEPTKSHFRFRLDKLKKHLRYKQQVKPQQIALELSDLVIYTKSKKFVSFQHSRDRQKFYENNSVSETEALWLIRHAAQEFIYHNMKFISRIYPKGSRIGSTNIHPQEFWNVGCQMVALNFQTPGVSMDLQDGRFRDNGACGYVLKPNFLCASDSTFDPNNLPQHNRPFFLQVKVISGFLLPPSQLSKSNTANPFVTLEIHGVPVDQCSMKTKVKKINAFNPQWNKTFTFSIQVPELAMVRFCVEDHTPVIGNEFLGQYTLPLSCISKGYRHIPLLNRHGQSLLPASLFVHILYQ